MKKENMTATGLLFKSLKALHVIADFAWMAGMLYLPRLFVYHAGAAPGSELSETLKVMERRLLRGIVNPAMIVAYVTGALLIVAEPDILTKPFMWVKLLSVLALTGVHGFLAVCRKRFAADKNTRTARFYRIINEVPAALLIVIVAMIIIQPHLW